MTEGREAGKARDDTVRGMARTRAGASGAGRPRVEHDETAPCAPGARSHKHMPSCPVSLTHNTFQSLRFSVVIMSIQKEDVYETEDLPEAEQHMRYEETNENSEEVERIHIDMETALKRFKGRMINADHVDFSDSIARKRRTGYGSGAYVLEVVGPNVDETETIEQKFHRLNYELIELAEAVMMQKEKSKENTSTVDESDVIAMLDTVRAVHLNKTAPPMQIDDASEHGASAAPTAQWANAESRGSDVSHKSEHGASAAPTAQWANAESRYLALESRLKRIEQLVGGGCDAVDEVTKKMSRAPLAETMEDLKMRVQLLHPTHVDGLHSRINQVLAKMKQAEEKKLEKMDSDFEEKVSSLYELMTKWDNTCVGLPAAVQRIHGLQRLHEQAQQFSTRLAHLVGTRAQLMKSLEGEQMAMFDFRQQTADALTKLANDMEKINARIEALKK
uniref:Dynactin subunit 2 n=1 Tax=Ascaris lumbricoides TaxID=6252 RepID=A0A9J2PG38_ASCLU